MPILTRLAALTVLLSLACPAFALDDTPQNREEQAGRYLKAVPPQSMMADMTTKMAQSLPANQQEQFKQAMTKYLDMNKLTAAIGSAMQKTFTADELQALADFYGSAIGKSAISKMANYYAAVMPSAMGEIQAAFTKSQEEAVKGQSQDAAKAQADAPKAQTEAPK